MNKTLRRIQPIRHVLLIILVALSLVPFMIMLLMSAKDPVQLFTNFWKWPDPVRFRNYVFGTEVTGQYIINSVIVSVSTCIATIAFAAVAAYALARLKFIGNRLIYTACVALLMVPGVFMLVPLYLTVRDLSLLNSYAGLILPQIAGSLPLAIFLFHGFFADLPEALFDAARIDGASELRVLYNLVLPLSKPIISTVAVLIVLGSWNNYLWPLLCVRDEGLRTLPLGLAFLLTERNLNHRPDLEMAAYVIGAIPLVVCFIFAMRTFVRGLSGGALKG